MENFEIYETKMGIDLRLLSSADRVVIHGAAYVGKSLYSKLKRAGIEVYCFCDNNSEKLSKEGYRIPVFSPKEFINSICDEEVFVICCTGKWREPLEQWKELASDSSNSIRFISEWCVSTLLYQNRKLLYGSDTEIVKLYNQEDTYTAIQLEELAISFLRDISMASSETIWLLQPGKVGSTSIMYMLRRAGLKCIQLHGVSFPKHILNHFYEIIWKQYIKLYLHEGMKLITILREPIERDYSAFWQPFSDDVGFKIRLWDKFNVDILDLYKIYTNMLLVGNDYIREKMDILTPWVWNNQFEWYDEEYRDVLGIDLYAQPFDKERGYSEYKLNKCDIFVVQLEKLEESFDALKKFAGNTELEYLHRYASSNKRFSFAYDCYKNEIEISKAYFDYYYGDNKKYRHFYSDKDIERYRRTWEKFVV